MKLLTATEAADHLNLRPAWVRRLCQQGRIQAQKVGRDWVIPESALDEFAKKSRKVGRPPHSSDPLSPK